MKNFMYFESTEGGMEYHEGILGGHHMTFLRGWMSKDCLDADMALGKWMETCDVGESFDHRMGVCVRMKDLPDPKELMEDGKLLRGLIELMGSHHEGGGTMVKMFEDDETYQYHVQWGDHVNKCVWAGSVRGAIRAAILKAGIKL